MTFTVKEICERIWELEERYELNHMEIQGTYPWLIIRMYVYYEITRKTQVFESAQQASLSLFDKVKSFTPFIKNSLLNNPFSGGKCDVLIFDHPRKVIFQNEYKDIYSYFLPQTLKENGKSFEIVESPYLNKHFTSKSYQKKNNVRFNDRILLGSFINKSRNRGKVPFTEDEKSRIDLLKKELETAFSIEIDLFKIIEDHILNFKYDYEKYLELLEKKQPKQVFLVVAYENKALVSACHEKNIEVIELQHGTISPYHLGYSYPKETCKKDGKYKEIEYFPDKILSFGDYWQNACSFPIGKENIISMGYPYFNESSLEFMKIDKNHNQIIFISQGVIGKYLSKFAYETARNLEDYKIIYKLHPGEYATWRENYESLVKAEKMDNFKVIDKSEPPLYELFAKSEYQVGAFSTAIYEGLSFNCKTFIIDAPGIEYLDALFDKGIVLKVDDSDDMIEKMKDSNLAEYDKNYIFKPYDKSVFDKILK